jgi:adenylate cyclase
MRKAAILNLDMRGFTTYAAEADPNDAMSLLAAYQSRMVPVIIEHGGSIDKFLGDGIMATFGATEPSQTYAADGLRALEATIAAARAWREERGRAGLPCPAINGALASGTILFGAVGDETRLEFTVIGDAVNLSAKLEKMNKILKIEALCDRQTYDLARAQGFQPSGEVGMLDDVEVPGVERPTDLAVIAR